MPPKKKVKKTTVFSDDETSDREEETLIDKNKKDKIFLADKENKLEAQKRESEFFKEHQGKNNDDILKLYIDFAKEDEYYKVLFKLNPPTVDYIKDKKNYYKKYEISDEEEIREKNFLRAMKDEKDPYIILQKFKEYVEKDDLLQMKFKNKKLTPVYVKYLINKYFKEEKEEKNIKENNEVSKMLKTLNATKKIRDRMIEYLEAYDYSEYQTKIYESILASDLTDDDIHTMINQYITDEKVYGIIYFKDYFKEYLKVFEKDPVKFREEQKIKKFLEDLLLLTKKYNLEADINRKYVIENDIYKILTEFEEDENAPESRKKIFSDMRYNFDIEVYYKLINTYLQQYLDIEEQNRETFINFEDVFEKFKNSEYLKKYKARKEGKKQRQITEEEEKEERELEALPERKYEIKKSLIEKDLLKTETRKNIQSIYSEPVNDTTINFAKEKISEALLNVVKLPEYDMNSKYINDVIEHIRNTTTNTYEFLKKLVDITVYLTDDVNKIIKFKYVQGTTGKIGEASDMVFKSNIRNLFYLPNILVDLTISEKLPNIFYNSKIPLDTRQNILYGINTLINSKIQTYAEELYYRKNLYANMGMIAPKYNPPELETVYVEKPFKLVTFEEKIKNFEEDYVFYNEEFTEEEEIVYKDGTKQKFIVDKNNVYKFLNKDLWKRIQNNNLINPFSRRVFNPEFIKEFEEIYMGKLKEKEAQEARMMEIQDMDIDVKDKSIIPDLLELINKELNLIQNGYNDDKYIEPEPLTKKEDVEQAPQINQPTDEVTRKPLISFIVKKEGKEYFVIVDTVRNDPIKWIYNIKDETIDKPEYNALITNKDNIREQMLKQKALNPNNFYVIMYFKNSTNVKPTKKGDIDDNEFIIEYLTEALDNIKNNSGYDIKNFVNDLTQTTYSTQEDYDRLNVTVNDKNKAVISFSKEENIVIPEKNKDMVKKYIGFMFEKDTNKKYFVILSTQGLYISAVYDINEKDFIDKDEERGVLKSKILKEVEKLQDDNIYASIYLNKNKLKNCSDDLILKYLGEISDNKDIKGKGDLVKYVNNVDGSLCIDTDELKVVFDDGSVASFTYKGKDYIDNKDLICPLKLPTEHNLDRGDSDKDSDSDSDSDKDSLSDSSSVSDSDSGSVSDSDKDSVVSSDNTDGTDLVKCVNCSKNISKDKSLKSMAIKNGDDVGQIHLCCFDCFEKYDKWPSLKKPKKTKKKDLK